MPALLRRLLLGGVIAAAIVALIDRQLGRADASGDDRPPPRLAIDEPPPVALPPGIQSGCAWLIYVCGPEFSGDPDAIPPAIRPLASIAADGRVRVLRPAPPPEQPGRSDWIAAGIIVPAARLDELSPRAGAALLELVHAWRGVWPVSLRDRLVTLGAVDPKGLAVLLRHAR